MNFNDYFLKIYSTLSSKDTSKDMSIILEGLIPPQSGEPLHLRSLSSATIFIVLLNVLGELILILYFLQKSRKSCSTLLYLLLLLGDLISSTTGIFACFEIYRFQRHPNSTLHLIITSDSNMAAKGTLSWTWMDSIRVGNAVVLGISSRFSAAVFCVLSVVRLLVIVRPFFKASRKRVICWVTAFTVGVSLSQAIPYSMRHFSCSELIFSCVPAIRETSMNIISTHFNLTFFQIIPFLLPCLLILAVAVTTIIHYLRQKTSGSINTKLVHSYFTIIFYSAAFLLTTVPYVIASFIYYLQLKPRIEDETTYHFTKVKMFYIFLTLFLHLRSSLTILVFITRSSGFRHFLVQLKTRQVRLLSFVNPDMDRAIQTTLQNKEIQDRIRNHVNSNPAVKETALSVRWDRKVRIHKIGVVKEVVTPRMSVVPIKLSPLSAICEVPE